MKKDLIKIIDQLLLNSNKKYLKTEDFAEDVLQEYILAMGQNAVAINHTHSKEAKDEILLEILEILKKKMYGFYDINEYREYLTRKDS